MSDSSVPAGRRPVDLVPMPPRIARLPRNGVGYPIPWFVATLDGGARDFRIASPGRKVRATRDRLCWICGGRLRASVVSFLIGPMCAVNRISGEPPSHLDCATYAARVCPFLTRPAMRRRDGGMPDGYTSAPGEMIERNPGVALLWTTRTFKPFHPHRGQPGLLYQIGMPTETGWYAEGRAATRAEVLGSITAGLPELVASCRRDHDPVRATRELDQQIAWALTLVPST